MLLDPHPLSKEHTTSISEFDVTAHADLADHLPRALYRGFAFKKDASGFYYAVENRESGQGIFYHALGSDLAKDVELFGKGYGADTWILPQVSEDGRYLLINVQHGWAKGEIYIQKIETGAAIRPLVTGLDAKFDASFAGDYLFLRTDWKAPKRRILRIDLRDPAQEKWHEVVPEGQDSIEDSAIIGGKLFVTYLHNVVSRISIFSLEGKPLGEIAIPGLGSAGISGRADQKDGIFYFSSYTSPYSAFRYDTVTGAKTLWYREDVPFLSDGFETEQVWYPSKDGTKIPMFLIHRKGMKPDGITPTILYGYGGFNVSITPFFDPQAAWWMEHGGLYAVANLRGGGEFGEEWHRAGMLDKKQNVFDDFIAGAEWLISQKYTNPGKLGIWGAVMAGCLWVLR